MSNWTVRVALTTDRMRSMPAAEIEAELRRILTEEHVTLSDETIADWAAKTSQGFQITPKGLD